MATQLLRQAVQQHGSRAARLAGPWDALRSLSSAVLGAEVGGVQQAAAPQPAAAARPTPAQQQQRRQQQQQQPYPDVLESQRAPALEARQQMQEALARGDYKGILNLLKASEAKASAAAGTPAAWHPLDRAALYDCALQASAQRADADRTRYLVSKMWKQGLPVGIVATTSVLRALCASGRQAAALEHLRQIPSKRQRTPMFTLLLRSCNEAGAGSMGCG